MSATSAPALDCHHFTANRCRSCQWLELPYESQLARKDRSARTVLTGAGVSAESAWTAAVPSRTSGFRNKAKMVVAGTLDQPTLGILDPESHGVDLRDCALHTPGIQAALPHLAEFVRRARLTPYDIGRRTGELKHVLVTESPTGRLMVRWVLRSTEAEARIRKHQEWLESALPTIDVVSLNIQPDHSAVLEGKREIVLSERSTITMSVNDIPLQLGPRSFFQTNTDIAGALYRQARSWVAELDVTTIWDLYCGVGGFALTLAEPGRVVTGVESSEQAISSAVDVADRLGAAATFVADDATSYAMRAVGEEVPDLVVINPPRRGLGIELSSWLDSCGSSYVLYSSCNPESLARDLAAMPSLRVSQARLFDMFPHTEHVEVLMLLTRE